MIQEAWSAEIDALLARRLEKAEQREAVVSALMQGFVRLPKKALPDLAARLLDMESSLRRLAEQAALDFVNGRLVIKVSGSSESLMTQLRRGTGWYAPWPDVDEVLLAAALNEPSK